MARRHAFVGVLVVLSLAALGGGAGAGQVASQATPADVAVTGVTVSPSAPVVGEQVTVTATIQNFQGSSEAYVVEAVALRSGPDSDFEEFDRVEDPGRIAPGASLQVPLTRSYGSSGTREFRVVVFGETESGENVRLSYPATVRVTDAEPKVDVDVRSPVAGAPTNATVTVANGLERDVRNVEVRLRGDVDVARPRQVRSTLAAGETGSFQFRVTPTDAGETDLTAVVEYTLAGGPTRTTRTTTTVQTRDLADPVRLATNVTGSRVAVTATNLGDARVDNLVLRGESADATLGERALSRLGPGESRTVSLPVESVSGDGGTARVDVGGTYDVGDRTREVDGGTVTLRHLVTLNATATRGRVAVRVSNLGNLRADRVVVRGRSPNATVGQAVVPSLEPGETANVTLRARDVDSSATVDLVGTYVVGESPASTDGDRVTLYSNPGRIDLTGLDVETEGDRVTISGSASNVGLSEVDSVVVSVVDEAGVTPVPPSREYFVGSVPASDFVSFDVTAQVEGDVEDVPLEVSYIADGRRQTERFSVPVRESAALTPSPSGGGGGGLIVPALVGLVVVAVVGVIVFVGWRNRSVGD